MCIRDRDCDYSIQGSGPALFLSHGIGAAKNAWRFLLPELSKHFTVVTYDLRGHGNSPVTNKNFSLDDLVLDLEKIREKTKIENAHFAGHSLGGMIAPAYSIKFPNRVLSVGLLSTVIAAFYYLRIIKIIYFDKEKEKYDSDHGIWLKFSLTFSTILILLYFIFPSQLIEVVSRINII